MNVIEVDVGKTKLFSIGQQYNSNALVIHFVNLPNRKNKYIYYKIDDIEEEIPLVSDLFIVSRPYNPVGIKDIDDYFDIAKIICKKYGVPCLDLREVACMPRKKLISELTK